MPQPTNRWAWSPAMTPDRMATTNSPSPRASTQPTGPAYQPRSRCSCSSSSSRAASRGQPPTAGVGCSRSTRSRMPRSSRRSPEMSVARCCTVGSRTMCGARSMSSRGGQRRQGVAQHLDHDRVLLAILLGCQERRGEVRVDHRIGVPAGRARERDGPERPSGGRHQTLGRGTQERPSLATEREHRHGSGLVGRRCRRRETRRGPRGHRWARTRRGPPAVRAPPCRCVRGRRLPPHGRPTTTRSLGPGVRRPARSGRRRVPGCSRRGSARVSQRAGRRDRAAWPRSLTDPPIARR